MASRIQLQLQQKVERQRKMIYQIEGQKPNKTIFSVQHRKEDPQLSIKIRSNFDSGNLMKVEIGLNNSLVLTPANDCVGTQYESHSKGWFYFGVSGFSSGMRQKFVIKRMNQLAGGQTKFLDYFKPVFKYGEDGSWERVEQTVTFNKDDDTELHFEFIFEKNIEVFFAYSIPFSFEENQKLLTSLKNQAKLQKNIYFHDDVIINSVQGRPIHLVTISSNDNKLTCRQSPIDDNLFKNTTSRAFKFAETKKVVIISARVHPGEAPSSHTVNGLLKYLVSKDARAELLRKNFVFKIIPMLNPDGVYNGHYRMDTLNQNLNRFYIDPDYIKQPSSFALKKLGQYFKLEERLHFFMDLHAHPQKKGNFIYGNSIQNHVQQVETQLFPKILSLNCVQFDYENSCFSKNHMTHKDRNQDYSKQGCSRVVFHRQLGVLYSYTMECGYTISNYLNQLHPLSNPHRKVDKLGLIHSDMDSLKAPYYSTQKKKYFSIKSYENLGKCIAISILDLFQLNPFSRILNGPQKTLPEIRQTIGQGILKFNKQFKTYSQKVQQPILQVKKSEREKNNQTCTVPHSLPKAIIGFFQRKIISSKYLIARNERNISKRKTLPKMKTFK